MVRAIEVPHAARKDEFRRNLRSHSRRFLFYIYGGVIIGDTGGKKCTPPFGATYLPGELRTHNYRYWGNLHPWFSTPLVPSHDHRLPGRAFSSRAARGRCFNPKRSGDGTLMQIVLGESRVTYRLSSRAGSNSCSRRHQYEELVDNSGRWLASTASSACDAGLRVPG